MIRNVVRLLTERGALAGDAAVKARHVVDEMNRAFDGARLDDSDWNQLEPLMPNHPKDRHVLAAAMAAKATHLITENTKDFAGHFSQGCLVRADAFVGELLKDQPERVIAALVAMSARASKPPVSPLQLAEMFAGGQFLPKAGNHLVQILRGDAPVTGTALRSVG